MICAAFTHFRDNTRGVAAIEFALILPALITIYFGTVELTRVADNSRRITLFARTVADLTGRADNPKPSASDMIAITSAAAAILGPFNTSGLKIVINAMGVESISGTLFGGVCSSWQQNSTTRAALTVNGSNGLPDTPALYQYDGARYILAEVSMTYTPLIGSKLYALLFGSRGLMFSRQIPWAQRTIGEIVMPSGSACPNFS